MSDIDGDGIWSLEIILEEGTYDYKFAYDNWTGQEDLTEGDPCTLTTDGFTNRSIIVADEAILAPVCWSSCDACVVAIHDVKTAEVTVWPQPFNDFVYIGLQNDLPTQSTILITDLTGRVLQQSALQQNNQQINLEMLSEGVYLLSIERNNQIIFTSTIIKQ